MDERRNSTTTPPSVEVTRTNFTTLRKGGVDPTEVRVHLERVAREMASFEKRVRELQELLVEAQRRAANPSFEEGSLANALGSQSASILRAAHDEAARVTAEAQERSAHLFAESQQRSAGHLIEAQERALGILADAESTALTIDREARLAAERLIQSAKLNSEALIERGREQGRSVVQQAADARKEVLNDLAFKRKALHIQVEQLRAARDTLSTFVTAVREQIEGVLAGLSGSDEAARTAALDALRNRPPMPEPSEEELLAGTPLRQVLPIDSPDTRATSTKTKTRKAPKTALTEPDQIGPTLLEDDPSGTDVVNEIFARLRKATLEERGAAPTAPRKPVSNVKSTAPNAELFASRDGALEESLTTLTRKVKRALQDDQNSMLERLRDVTGMITTEFEDEHVQRSRYADAALDALSEAASAGAQFAFEIAGASANAVSNTVISDCAADLAVTIVLALRKRIMADGAGDATERANTAYKEWRGARVERLCRDAARRAFHAGVLAASQGRTVRFYVAPNDAPCDACALDAASGNRGAGELFPSGSAFPPLHAGCACAVLPV